MFGGNAMGVAGFRFDRTPIGGEAMIIGPGDGFKTAMADIDKARVFVAAACLGILRSSLRAALEYGKRRKAFGRSLLDFQGLEWSLVDVATSLEAARLLTQKAAILLDKAQPATIAAAHAKKFATRAAVSGISACMAAMGANGLRMESPLARHLAAAKIAETLDGTTAIQNVVIGRALRDGF
jgi:alkylation response protein AidB-like acyl-CoA dehydrogenase